MAVPTLWGNKKEREYFENAADLFALLKTTEKLERAYVRDAIPADQYEAACKKLIGQFRTLWGSMKTVIPDINVFAAQYNMDCPMALTRLVHSGLPATIEHGRMATGGQGTSSAVAVAECVQHFITSMDSLKLNLLAVDQVYPLLSDLLQSLNKLPSLPPDHSTKVKTKTWVSKLNSMAAHEELSEEQSRQLLFDLESSYNLFMADIGRG